jgi:hypothetical protein
MNILKTLLSIFKVRRDTKVLYDMDDDPKRSASTWLDSCARHTLVRGREMLVVGRCRLTLSNSDSKAPIVFARENLIMMSCFQVLLPI